MPSVIVESFTLDHTKVQAPFVRRCGTMTTPHNDIISKFDLRFTQPNLEAMPTGAVHTLEHLLAGFIREEIEDVVDLSPMGCRTGFYLILIGDIQEEVVAKALINALEKVLLANDVPATNAVQCGNYRDHSLFGAKEYAKQVLKGLIQRYTIESS